MFCLPEAIVARYFLFPGKLLGDNNSPLVAIGERAKNAAARELRRIIKYYQVMQLNEFDQQALQFLRLLGVDYHRSGNTHAPRNHRALFLMKR